MLPDSLFLFLRTLALLLVALMLSVAVYAFSINTDKNISAQSVSADQLVTFNLGQGKKLADILEHEKNARLFFVGESHTRYDHHLVQLAALKELFQQSPKLAIGAEWFQQPFQQHLDDYIAGRISEAQMLERTRYFERWRYDYRLYRPIMQFARDKNIPVIALNAEPEVSKALAKTTYAELPAHLKSQIPESFDWSDKDYENRLRTVFEMHTEYASKFEDFLRGQLTWDESMAYRTADFLTRNPDHRMIVFAGSGHIEFGSGIPNRVKRYLNTHQVSLLITDGRSEIDKDMADYLVLSKELLLNPAGLIGAFLETENQQLVIRGFSSNSVVQDAGVPQGAVIVSVDNTAVSSFTEFKLTMLDKEAGDTIQLSYVDNADQDYQQAKTVTLMLR